MKPSLGTDYSLDDLKILLKDAQSIITDGFDSVRLSVDNLQAVGTLFHNVGYFENQIAQTALARLGTQPIDILLPPENIYSRTDIMSQIEMISSSFDLILSSYSDLETFANGYELTNGFSNATKCPLLNISDDVYAPQSALSELLAFQEKLGSLGGKRIVISWGFGTKFVLPSVAHSLLEFGAKLGAHMKIVFPNEFSLLNRVVKNAKSYAEESNGSIEVSNDFTGAFENADAVYALNWCRFDDYRRHERNADSASGFRNWYFKDDMLPSDCLFSSQPPLEIDLLVDAELAISQRNLSQNWFERRIAMLLSSISYILK